MDGGAGIILGTNLSGRGRGKKLYPRGDGNGDGYYIRGWGWGWGWGMGIPIPTPFASLSVSIEKIELMIFSQKYMERMIPSKFALYDIKNSHTF